MSKFDFIKNAATKVVDAAKAVDAIIVDPVQNKVTETYTEHKYMKAAKEVMRDQILTVGKTVVESKEAEKARLAQEAADAKIAAEMAAAGLVYNEAYAEVAQNTFAS